MVKKILNKQNGQATLLFVSVFTIITLFFTYFAYQQFYNFSLIKERAKTYLCYKFLHTKTIKYSSQMALANTTLMGLYPLTLLPPTAPAARSTRLMVMAAQTAMHISYLKSLLKNNFCSFTQAAFFIKNIPYRYSGPILKRNYAYVALQRKKKWKNYVTATKEPYFTIIGNYQLSNVFAEIKFIKSQEITMDLPLLKQLSGSP